MDARATQDLFADFLATASQIRHSIYRMRQAGDAGFEHGQGRLMRILLEQEDVTPKALAEQMRIRPASLSELAGKLEAKGYIQRRRSDKDKRVVHLSLTPEGKAEAERLQTARVEYGGGLFAALSEKDAEDLARILNKLMAVARQENT